MTKPKIRDLLARKGDPLQLEALTGDVGLDREIPSPEASSPGLVLAGYTARFVADRLHILGETEIAYLGSLDAAARHRALETFFGFELPAVIVTKSQKPPAELLALARAKGVAVIRTKLKTAEFYRRLKPFLDDVFAPSTTVHASLADVFGVGLLFLGRSGIGKSECVLDLVERIEVVVQLEDWDASHEYDRTGLDSQQTVLLDVAVPLVTVPLNPGKNLTVICEVVAMNHLLRYTGVDSARSLNERLLKRMRARSDVQEYLEEDYE